MARVSDIMTRSVVAVQRSTPLDEAARKMTAHDVDGLPVIGPTGHIVGVISKTDLVDLFAEDRIERKTPVGDVMTPVVVSVAPEDDVTAVIGEMVFEGVHRAVVVDHGEIVGMITAWDVLRAIGGGELRLEDGDGTPLSIRPRPRLEPLGMRDTLPDIDAERIVSAGAAGLVGGAIVGATTGAIAGPPGATLGAIVGSAVGAATAAALTRAGEKREKREAEGDEAPAVPAPRATDPPDTTRSEINGDRPAAADSNARDSETASEGRVPKVRVQGEPDAFLPRP